MSKDLLKSMALWGISKGLRLPQAPLDRLNEFFFLRKLLIELKIDCVLDVGANRGKFARQLRGIGYKGLIISFEPVSSEFLAMEEHFKNDLKWRGYQIALGSKEESMYISIPGTTFFSSLLESTVAEEDTRKELIEVKRLDNILSYVMNDFTFSRPFLKMDTQGYDLEVFRGVSGHIEKIQGIQSEISIQPLYKNMPHYLQALETYEAAGFDLYNLSVVNRVHRVRHLLGDRDVSNGGLLELNCFMRRARCA